MTPADLEAIVRAFLAKLDPAQPRTTDVVTELAGHLEEGMRRHMVLGKRPEDALVAALSELGSLAPVARAASGGVREAAEAAIAAWSREGLLESILKRIGGGGGRWAR